MSPVLRARRRRVAAEFQRFVAHDLRLSLTPKEIGVSSIIDADDSGSLQAAECCRVQGGAARAPKLHDDDLPTQAAAAAPAGAPPQRCV